MTLTPKSIALVLMYVVAQLHEEIFTQVKKQIPLQQVSRALSPCLGSKLAETIAAFARKSVKQ